MSDNPVVNGSVVFEKEVADLAPEPVQLLFSFMERWRNEKAFCESRFLEYS